MIWVKVRDVGQRGSKGGLGAGWAWLLRVVKTVPFLAL